MTYLRPGNVWRVGHGAVLLDVFDNRLDVDCVWCQWVWTRMDSMKVWEAPTNHASVKVLHPARLGNVARDAQVE